jgi:Na+-translocating ferredoxin:NAD+ oxidoreductase RnfD subunit
MSAHAAPVPSGLRTLTIRGQTYPILLPKLQDPRLHLAATIVSLQVVGQIGFHFRLSISQIAVSLLTCAVLEVGIAAWRQRVILWPASALLTGNGVAFILRVPGTHHGDWWTFKGWWIFVATSAVSLLSKHAIRWRGTHVFNPSNIGLVLCFLLLGRGRAEPLDFWWGPMSGWLVLALAIILAGGFAILSRLKLLWIAVGFWLSFAIGIATLAATDHAMTARWHLGPIAGFHFWSVLVTSPEVLVFLFFMITDPKTAPREPRARLTYAVSLGLLGALLIAPMQTEFSSKVALLGSLAVVCAAMPLLRAVTWPRPGGRTLVLAGVAGLAAYGAAIVAAGLPARLEASHTVVRPAGRLPAITILPSPGVQTQLDERTAELIAHGLAAVEPATADRALRIHLEPGTDQNPPTAVAQLGASTYRLHLTLNGVWALATTPGPKPVEAGPRSPALTGNRLTDVAASVGLGFRQGSFRFGMSNDYRAMMGGGVCWLDYDDDGWEDLFAVNSYSSADTARWEAHGGLPTSALYRNDRGSFQEVTKRAHAGLAVQGDGCAAADLNGDGRTDLLVTTTTGIDLLWNGNGTFSEGARAAGMTASGWYTGVAVSDVNGDGRPDVFVAGYADPSEPVPGSIAGFPTNLKGVRDLLYLNEGPGADGRARFREVGVQAGLEVASLHHGLGAQFVDVNDDGRPDLYVANDEDANQLYLNVPWPGGVAADPSGLGFRFEDRAAAEHVGDSNAGMGIASSDAGHRLGLFVTNSRNQPSAAYVRRGSSFADARPLFDRGLGTGFAGWGVSWVDLANSGRPDLVLTAGAIPVTSLAHDAEPVRVLGPAKGGYGNVRGVLGPKGLLLNGRGLAAADVRNDGRLDVAINTIGGRLVLLQPSGPSGHWLDVALTRFVPGVTVTATLGAGSEQTRVTAAGSSYLSSEDPRVHFGLGAATRVARLVVRFPWGARNVLTDVPVDRILQVTTPALPHASTAPSTSYLLAGCTPRAHASVARLWDAAAVSVLRRGGASEPVQARDLFDVSASMWDAWAAYDPHAKGYFVSEKATAADPAAARDAAIGYAAYRLLVWRASFGRNVARAFAELTGELRALCYSPDFTSTEGTSPAALGNRIAAAAIARGEHDGSNEAQHYADPTYVSANAPLVLSQPGTTAHDPTFWQPLAVGRMGQAFSGSQWGRVAGFGKTVLPAPRAPFGVPTSAVYRNAAVAVIRATASAAAPQAADPSPLAWNTIAEALPRASLSADLHTLLALNGALQDAAIATWRAKRASQAPRPVSMIRYLAFDGTLPLVPGLIRRDRAGHLEVLERGRWVRGDRWTPPAATPPSPGWVSEDAAFAYAAGAVLAKAGSPSFAAEVRRAAHAGVATGLETPAAESAGRAVGEAAGRRALALAARYVSAP